MDVHSSRMDRRFMPPMQWAEVHNRHWLMDSSGVAEKGSEKLVWRAHTELWEPVLGFRSTGQHARCTMCAQLSKTRRDHPDDAERAHADNVCTQHMRRAIAMRRVGTRFSNLSNMSCEPGCRFPSQCLHVCIDGLGQAKGRSPRNLEHRKPWSVVRRPQLHVVGGWSRACLSSTT